VHKAGNTQYLKVQISKVLKARQRSSRQFNVRLIHLDLQVLQVLQAAQAVNKGTFRVPEVAI
jgi:hypothetical protein